MTLRTAPIAFITLVVAFTCCDNGQAPLGDSALPGAVEDPGSVLSDTPAGPPSDIPGADNPADSPSDTSPSSDPTVDPPSTDPGTDPADPGTNDPPSTDPDNGPVTGPTLAGCPMFPANNIWNTRVDTLPVAANSAAYITSIGPTRGLHADFGSGLWDGGPIGIPYVVVGADQPKVAVTFDYDDESDPGPYPVPSNPPIEGGPSSDGDRHILIVDTAARRLYELYYAFPQPDGTWHAGSGAIYDLTSHALRPAGWTSADAAGLPILPGLVRYDEVAAGEIKHAIRFTVQITRKSYVWPARHYASSNTSASVPPMGQRFRLKAGFNVAPYPARVQIILNAMKKYGLILADNGSNWYISGAPDERWNNDELATLRNVHGSDFEAVDVSGLMIDPDSGQSALLPPPANGSIENGSLEPPAKPGSYPGAAQ